MEHAIYFYIFEFPGKNKDQFVNHTCIFLLIIIWSALQVLMLIHSLNCEPVLIVCNSQFKL